MNACIICALIFHVQITRGSGALDTGDMHALLLCRDSACNSPENARSGVDVAQVMLHRRDLHAPVSSLGQTSCAVNRGDVHPVAWRDSEPLSHACMDSDDANTRQVQAILHLARACARKHTAMHTSMQQASAACPALVGPSLPGLQC